MKLSIIACIISAVVAGTSAKELGGKPVKLTEDDLYWERVLQGSMSAAPPTPRPPSAQPPTNAAPVPSPTAGPPGPGPQPTEAPPTGAPPTNPPPSAGVGPPTPRTPSTQNIAEVLAGDSRFTTLVDLVVQRGLLPALEEPGPLTVFAPTDQAFIVLNLPPDVDPELVDSVLLYHVVGELIDPIVDGESYTTLNGASVTTTNSGGDLKVEDSNIIDTLPASNGIIYVIDAVLIPPADPAPAPTPVSGRSITCSCDACPDTNVIDPTLTVMGLSRSATCAEWVAFGCDFVQPDACGTFQVEVAECCEVARRNLRSS